MATKATTPKRAKAERRQAVRRCKESCWAVQIGGRPKCQPYLMIAGAGNFTPHLFNSEAEAEAGRLLVLDPSTAHVVKVSVEWRARRTHTRKASPNVDPLHHCRPQIRLRRWPSGGHGGVPMTSHEVHSSLLREQAAAGVVVVPPSVEFDLGRLLNMGTTSCTTAASLILVGAMAGWLDTYGGYSDWTDYAAGRDATPLLDRLHAATLRVLRTQAKRPGKHRFARGLTNAARKDLIARWVVSR